MSQVKPVTLVGGGLAGLSLGVALARRGVPVELWEAGELPRHRVCGEFICGVRPDTLDYLGIAGALGDAYSQCDVRWHFRDRGEVFSCRLPEPALGISRYVLDLRLVHLLEEHGATVRLNSKWRGDSVEGIVGAKGRQAARTDWMGFKIHGKGFPMEEDLRLYLGDGAYLGICRVEEEWYNLCGLFRKRREIRANKEVILRDYARASGLTTLAEWITAAELREGSAVGVAGVEFGKIVPGAAYSLRLGDAWAVIPPFTGNGMSMAFESAALAVEPVCGWSKGEIPWEAAVDRVQRAHFKAFHRRLRTARIMHTWLSEPGRQKLAVAWARSGLLPFRMLFSLTHR